MKRSKILEDLIQRSTTETSGFDYRFGNTTSTIFDKDKFAELLIEECAKICLERATEIKNTRIKESNFELKILLSTKETSYEDAAIRIKSILE